MWRFGRSGGLAGRHPRPPRAVSLTRQRPSPSSDDGYPGSEEVVLIDRDPAIREPLLSGLPIGLLLVRLLRPRPAAVLALAAAVLVLPACGGSQSPSEPTGGLGRRAPGFSLPSADGGRVGMSDFAGKPVLLYFSMGPG